MLSLCIVLLCALMLGVRTQEPLFVPCNETTVPYEGPPLPTFPDQYQTNVEANIVQKNYTKNVREYYDYTNNRFVFESSSRDGTSVRMVGNAEQEEMRLIYPNGTCHVRHINDTGSGSFSFVSGPTGTHVRSVKDLMAFGSEYRETYIGETVVRGIPVDHWQTCLKFTKHEGQFTLDFYFTSNTSYVVDGQRVRIPVRAELKGEGISLRNPSAGIHSFHHFYDFTNFHAGPIQDQQVFEIPPGVYCNGSTISKPLPPVNAQFTAGVEQVVETGDRHMERPMMIYMDHDSQIMRVDVTFPLNPEDVQKFGDKPLIYIKDENTNLLYIMDQWEWNCTVVKVTGSLGDSHGSFDSSDYFSLFKKDFLYQGKKMFRGFSVESWAYFNQTGSQITELLFHQDEVPSTGPPNGRPFQPNRQNPPTQTTLLKLVGVIEKTLQTDTQQETTVTRHFYGFIPGHPSLDVFDVSSCYSLGNQHRYMAFRVEVNYKSDVMYRKREFYTSLRSAIARGAGVSAVRVTAIWVEPNYYNDSETNVYFKLLDNQIYGMSTDNTGPDLAKAKVNLQSAIANGLNFDVQYPAIEKNFVVVKDTLWETTSSMSTWTYNPSNMKRYSAASMAGLGIGMVVVGAILGLLVSFAIYKKVNTDIPYQVTD